MSHFIRECSYVLEHFRRDVAERILADTYPVLQRRCRCRICVPRHAFHSYQLGQKEEALAYLKRTLFTSTCRRLCLEVHPSLLPPGVDLHEILSLVRSCGFEIIIEIARPPEVYVIGSRTTAQS
jgi:hypothetical protein